ncbi:MAG: NUDIX hydrolase [Saccharospirillaceae bacterium]|nr:NUDIX hydrolase [Pseudomonadales bacterium]NRB79614.1 NUDIX hydrolase [Saccharospirillaceae bacterium]
MKPITSEKEFLKNYNIHDFDVPLTSVDMSIFSIIDDELQVLLLKRNDYPAKGKWALPGGFIDKQQDSNLEDTAKRKLLAKTGVSTPYLEQVSTFGSKQRDPRGWSVTIVYMALIAADDIKLSTDDSSDEIKWQPVYQLSNKPALAFDHNEIFNHCYERLKSKVQYTSLPVNLLPEEFTLTELQTTFEIILDMPIEKKSFRRRILDAQILEETGNLRTGNNRPAKLYKANKLGKDHFFQRSIEGPR